MTAMPSMSSRRPMMELLKQLRLSGLANELPRLIEEARQGQLSYEAFLVQVLQEEITSRAERADERRLRKAKLPFISRIESFDFQFQPSVSKRLVHELASLQFIETATNVVLLGPPGVGLGVSGLWAEPEGARSRPRGALHDAPRVGAGP